MPTRSTVGIRYVIFPNPTGTVENSGKLWKYWKYCNFSLNWQLAMGGTDGKQVFSNVYNAVDAAPYLRRCCGKGYPIADHSAHINLRAIDSLIREKQSPTPTALFPPRPFSAAVSRAFAIHLGSG